MNTYTLLLTTHVGSAAISITFFIVRGIWALNGSPMLRAKFVRIAPHVIDTILLASAIALAIMIHQYPGTTGWLTVKVVALVCYIGLGMATLKGKTHGVRAAAFAAAVATFAFIVSVALTHNPLGIFSLAG
ncbi:MAG: SirB2 family protein [Pseudomonadales bacterium]|nr:SirB2 family protein [Pseudomonadales bacterium]